MPGVLVATVSNMLKTWPWPIRWHHVMGEVIESACEQINYLLNRTVPPRCLKCGSQDITNLSATRGGEISESGSWRHPGCEGVFHVSDIGRWNLATSEVKLIYTDEGIFSHEELVKATERNAS